HENSRVLQFASISFDAAVFEWAITLIQGGSLYLIAAKQNLVGDPLVEFLNEKRITLTLLSPTVLSTLAAKELTHLETLIVGGEASNTALLNQWYQQVDLC